MKCAKLSKIMPRKNYRTKPPRHTAYRWGGDCGSKQAYMSRQAAQSVADDQMKYSDVLLKVYFCPNCSQWHLTSHSSSNTKFERH